MRGQCKSPRLLNSGARARAVPDMHDVPQLLSLRLKTRLSTVAVAEIDGASDWLV